MCAALLALLIQQLEESSGLPADQVNASHIVRVVNVVPGDALCLVLFLWAKRQINQSPCHY